MGTKKKLKTQNRQRKGRKDLEADLAFIRSLRGCMKGSGALQYLLEERRKDNARNK